MIPRAAVHYMLIVSWRAVCFCPLSLLGLRMAAHTADGTMHHAGKSVDCVDGLAGASPCLTLRHHSTGLFLRDDARNYMLQQAMRALVSFRQKYGMISELASVLDAIDDLEKEYTGIQLAA